MALGRSVDRGGEAHVGSAGKQVDVVNVKPEITLTPAAEEPDGDGFSFKLSETHLYFLHPLYWGMIVAVDRIERLMGFATISGDLLLKG